MDFFAKLFGRKSKKQNPKPKGGKSPVNAIPMEKSEGNPEVTAFKRLVDTEQMMFKKQEFLEKKIAEQQEIAKINRTKNKAAALKALNQKKIYEDQLKQNAGKISAMEKQKESLEVSITNRVVVDAMSHVAIALKNVHKKMDVETVEEIINDINDQQDLGKEIGDLISNPASFGQPDVDEDELENELEGLIQEDLKDKFPDVPSTAQSAIKIPVKGKVNGDADAQGVTELTT